MNTKSSYFITLIIILLASGNSLQAQLLEVDGDVITEGLISPISDIGSIKGDGLTANNVQLAALHTHEGITVGEDGVEVDGSFRTTGWTQLGDSNDTNTPTFKIKQLTGFTTSGATNLIASIPHDLDSNKFINVSSVVIYDAAEQNGISENYTYNSGFQFHVSWDTTNISISRESTNSANITNKPVVITIIYVE